MSRDTCYKQAFKCLKCGNESTLLVWLSEVDKQKCKCKGKLEPQYEEVNESFSVGGKYKKGRPKKEANERRSTHFRKEILPTLGGWERKHFEKKIGKPL